MKCPTCGSEKMVPVKVADSVPNLVCPNGHIARVGQPNRAQNEKFFQSQTDNAALRNLRQEKKKK